MPKHSLRICALYPDLLNIYADRGNLMVLQRRCEWRGIGFDVHGVSLKEEIDPQAHNFFYIGGGQDRDQKLCAKDLVSTKKDALHIAADSGAVVFAVCGGFQLLGNYYEVDDERLAGIELVDIHTVSNARKRLIGNVAIEVELDDHVDSRVPNKRVLAGFENHGGRTFLGKGERPLGRVLRGHGNNNKDGKEGVHGGTKGTVFGTYLHGPLLPKNTWFADWLIATALDISVGDLPHLDNELEAAAHQAARRAAGLDRKGIRKFPLVR